MDKYPNRGNVDGTSNVVEIVKIESRKYRRSRIVEGYRILEMAGLVTNELWITASVIAGTMLAAVKRCLLPISAHAQ